MTGFAGVEVGDTFTGGLTPLTAEAITGFAAEFDPQPFHLDAELAADSVFGGLAGSGWHIAALTMRMLVEAVPLPCGLIGTEATLSWPTPSRPGDLLHIEARVEELIPSRSRPDRARAVVACETRNQDGEVRQRLRATLMVSDRPSPAA